MLERLRPHLTLANGIALAVLGLSIAAVISLQAMTHVNLFSQDGFGVFVEHLGWLGPLLYILLIAISVVVSQLPGVPLAIAAGAAWGGFEAGIYSIIGGFSGGMVAYFIGRTLGRSAVKALTGRIMYFSKERGEPIIGLLLFVTRLLPLFSFDIMSYAAGITRLSLPIYIPATLLGMIPSTFLLTFLGSSLKLSMTQTLAMSGVALLILVLIPIFLQRSRWLKLNELVHFET
jgi:uncharacterized membrane protein YdjX (TVP38/TMEM64 family)